MDIVFVSAPDDSARAKALAETLGRAGLRAVWDRTVPAGETYQSMMAARLAAAKVVLVLWSNRLLGAPALLDEAAAGAAGGRAVGVMIEAVKPPPAFSSAPVFDLSGGRGAANEASASLVSALRERLGLAADAPPAPGRARFVRRWGFWARSLFLALGAGAILFLSPEGQMGQGVGIAGRANGLIASVVIAFFSFAFARAALAVSGRWIGQETTRYFSRGYLQFGAISAALAALLALQGTTPGEGEAASSFIYGLASALITLPPLIAAGVALFRAMRRLIFAARGA
ncbi:MAG: toll/interleukin-1 receptor domain-containing protein [Hyphomonadaceae bacterium]